MSELIDREATVKQICKMGEMLKTYHDRDLTIAIALFVQDDKSAFPTITIPVAELDTTTETEKVPNAEYFLTRIDELENRINYLEFLHGKKEGE